MITHTPRSPQKQMVSILAIGTLCCLGRLALASNNPNGMHIFTPAEIQSLKRALPTNLGIPLELNRLVVTQLNYYARTEEGRNFVKTALANIEKMDQQEIIEQKMKEAKIPSELIAIPIVESGYEANKSTPGAESAGMWGFIKSTALNYDLHVNEIQDDRLDALKSTEAAIKYLSALKQQYGDWRLAIKGYNEGEESLDQDLKDFRKAHLLGSEEKVDPWQLEKEKEGKDQYLSRIMAMIIILKNRSLLN